MPEGSGFDRSSRGRERSAGGRARSGLRQRISTACSHCAQLLQELLGRSGQPGGPRGAVVYRGVVESEDETREWEQARADEVLRSHSASELAQLVSPFGSAERVAILMGLYRAEKTGQSLCEETGLSQGQLYHHIKDLLYLGYVRQSSRNLYDITPRGRQALLTVAIMVDDFSRH